MRRSPYRQRWREGRAIGVGRIRSFRRSSPGWCSIWIREHSDRKSDCVDHSDLLALLELTLGHSKAADCKSRCEKGRLAHCSADQWVGSGASVEMISLLTEKCGRYKYCRCQLISVEICRKCRVRMEVKTSSQPCHYRRRGGEKLTY